MEENIKIDYLNINKIKPYKRNAKKHPQEQIEQIINSIKAFGMNDPIGVWGEDNVIVEGHGRYLALREMGESGEVPVIHLDNLTDEQRKAYALAHNQLTMNTGFDDDILSLEMEELDNFFDMSDFGFFNDDNEEEQDTSDHFELGKGNDGALAKRFIIPPFSVLDTKTGEWRARNAEWLKITGDLSETRDTEGVGGAIGHLQDIASGQGKNGFTSNFDPVLAEIMYHWFCPVGGRVIDPFGGEQTKGIVACVMGLSYSGVEIRPEQVELNARLTDKYPNVRYFCGDSNNIGEILSGQRFDFCFTSPPYYDLECYSEEDMSALGTYEEFLVQYKNIFRQCYELLDDNSFCAVKVGEIRDKKTGANRCFVPDTVKILTEIGFIYYNDIIMLNPTGLAAIQANRNMRTRKVVKCHQNIPVFYKGNLKKIQEKLPPIEYNDEDFDE